MISKVRINSIYSHNDIVIRSLRLDSVWVTLIFEEFRQLLTPLLNCIARLVYLFIHLFTYVPLRAKI